MTERSTSAKGSGKTKYLPALEEQLTFGDAPDDDDIPF